MQARGPDVVAFSPAQYASSAMLAHALPGRREGQVLPEIAAMLVGAHRLVGVVSGLKNVKAGHREKYQIFSIQWCLKCIACVSGRHYN
jgi:hypothetical protein